jgi:hypothetical protein
MHFKCINHGTPRTRGNSENGSGFFRLFGVFRGLYVFRFDSPFNFRLWMMSEIDEQTQFQAGCLEVVVYLRTVFVTQFLHCLNFNNYSLKTDKIRQLHLGKPFSFVNQ